MASFSVTITTNTTPAITTTLGGTSTYQQFKNSLGNNVYHVDEAYLFSTLLKQIQGGFTYSKYDSDGNQSLQSIISAISPYQYQNSIFLDLMKKNLIIDGRDYTRFRMYPNASLLIRLFCERVSNGDTLDLVGENNFKAYEYASEKYDFFDQYVDLL